MRKFLALLMSVIITMSSTIISFAGEWKQDNVGWFYQNDDGSHVKDDWLTLGDRKYHFDSNGYMQTGLIEVNGIKHYLYTDGSLTYNWNTPEGYRVDNDGRILDDNTPGMIFSVIWGSGQKLVKTNLVVCRFVNEGKMDIVVDPVAVVITNGKTKNLRMFDMKTLTYCDQGIVPANKQETDFVFITDEHQQFYTNDNSTLDITISCESFNNNYSQLVPVENFARIHIEE
ncbi:hypothetical protein [Lacrimispora sp.]|uniref:hypothetical protein n=1 Tax=Lacrimispora sp. TaxID=2719234 RepID=UPI0028A63B9E|nr:hypothetical protein [Lacrimispora sp.]